MNLALRNLIFTIVVPGSAAVWAPWYILTRGGAPLAPVVWPAVVIIAAGAALYFWCLWNFATVGRGTPGPWDAPKQVVATGPYRWVRNPMYLSALTVIGGEALLFWSPTLLVYAAVIAVGFHLFVTFYEEPTLRRNFGESYEAYRRTVRRWIPHPPRAG